MSQTRNAKTAHTMVRAEATWKILMAFAPQATDSLKIAIGRSPDLEDSLLQDFATRPMNLTRAFHSVLNKQDPFYLKLLHGFLKHLPSRTVFTEIITHLRDRNLKCWRIWHWCGMAQVHQRPNRGHKACTRLL